MNACIHRATRRENTTVIILTEEPCTCEHLWPGEAKDSSDHVGGPARKQCESAMVYILGLLSIVDGLWVVSAIIPSMSFCLGISQRQYCELDDRTRSLGIREAIECGRSQRGR